MPDESGVGQQGGVMNKCLRITLEGEIPEGFLRLFIQKHARKLELEGTAQMIDGKVRVVVCGNVESVDSFLDVLHKGSSTYTPQDIEVEPFLKDRDYRGVFRVIE